MVDIKTSTLLLLAGFFHVNMLTAFQCDVKLKKVGCFKDTIYKRALPEQLLNERDKTSSVFGGILMSWTDPHYLPGFVCRCARIAKRKGYMYFGIRFYSECWSGPNSNMLHNKHGSSKKCYKNWSKVPNCDVSTGEQESNYVYKILDNHCATDFTPVGCFNDKQKRPRPLPNYVMNERDSTHKSWTGKYINWEKWNSYLPDFICRCARLAMDRKDDFFAIQFYAECWTGREGHSDYSRDGVSNACVGEDWKPCNCTSFHCSGKDAVNFVYKLNRKPKVRDVAESYPKTNYFRDMLFYRRPQHYYDYPKYRYFNDYKRRYDADDLQNVDDDYEY